MAKYTVTHTCGHETRMDLIGKHTGRQYRLEREREQPCLDCRNAQAATRNADAGLPTLAGSAKQVAWAERIRADLLAKLDAELTYERSLAAHNPVYAETVAAKEARRAALASQTSGAWFIDHR